MKLDRAVQDTLTTASMVDRLVAPAAHLDPSGAISHANSAWKALFDAQTGDFRNGLTAEDRARLETAIDDGIGLDSQLFLRTLDGQMLCLSRFKAPNQKKPDWLCQQVPIMETGLLGPQLLPPRLLLAFDAAGIGVFETNMETREVTWNRQLRAIYGYSEDIETLPSDIWERSIHPEDREDIVARTEDAHANLTDLDIDFRIVRPDGAIRFLRSRGCQYVDQNGTRRIIGVNWDITPDTEYVTALREARDLSRRQNIALEEARAEMEHISNHDDLTGLNNRRRLDQVTAAAFEKHTRKPQRLAFLHIDLDRFKQINDTLGHAAGDAVLTHVAGFLKENVSEDCTVARIGGDEFAIFIEDAPADAALNDIADRLIALARKPFTYAGTPCRYGLSIGIATCDDPKDAGTRLFADSDLALYHAKRKGRGRACFFSNALKIALFEKQKCADEILSGLENGEFGCVYQPQFDAKTLVISGVEALVRWHHPTRGLLTPDHFLHVSEELGVVDRLDKLVLERALADAAIWRAGGMPVPRLSVNVSARRLRDPQLGTWIKHLAHTSENVAFELLESVFLDDSDDQLAHNLAVIRDLGIEIEVDDFGTGHASIVGLLNLKPNRLKIDRQLIAPVRDSVKQRLLVKSIVEIGKVQGMDVVAEGVETPDHIDILRDLGCDHLQGYGLSRPISAPEIQALLAVTHATARTRLGRPSE